MNYISLRVEKLNISILQNNRETSSEIPKYNALLRLCPDVPVPEWYEGKMYWFRDYHNFGTHKEHCTFDVKLWLRILPKRTCQFAWKSFYHEFDKVREFYLL